MEYRDTPGGATAATKIRQDLRAKARTMFLWRPSPSARARAIATRINWETRNPPLDPARLP